MQILITGANGQLGLALQREIREQNLESEIICTDYEILDITNLDQVNDNLLTNRPDIVINCAAYTAVDKCEEDLEGAYKVNAIGARNLAMICDKIESKLVHISTDYIFSGEIKNQPLRESEIPNPQSVYGTSKLLGEEYVRTFCKNHFIMRTAWLYGDGNNFVRTMLNLAQTNTELNVIGDQFGNPTSTKDLAKAIVNLMQTRYYGTYHATCEGVCSWYDFACKVFELSNLNIKVNKVTSDQFIRPAKRPNYSALDNMMLKCQGLNTFRPWEEALKDYLEEEKINGQN